jgi:GTP-binding protein EngB required for normal cell division
MQVRDAIEQYAHLRDELLGQMDALLQTEAVRECPCEELREKLLSNTFNLVVVGQFKRGKTSFINALLGAEVLPVSVVPLTSIATVLTSGDELGVRVYFNDGKVKEIPSGALPEYVTEKGNPENVKDVSEVVVTYPSPYLKDGVRVVDTPGVGSVFLHNTDAAYQYLPKADAAVFMLSVDQPVSQAELDFLRDVRQYSEMIFFLLNKADYLSEGDLQEALSYTKGMLREAMGTEVRLFYLSAKLALEGKASGSGELLERSNFTTFSEALNRFLMEEKGKTLIRSVAHNLLRVVSQAKFELGLERKSLATPLDELAEKIALFEEKKGETLARREDYAILLNGEVGKIKGAFLDEKLGVFKRELTARVGESTEAFYKENRHLPLKKLNQALEGHVINEVRQAFNEWRSGTDNALAKEFEAVCKRFVSAIDDVVDKLFEFSSSLFDLPFEAVKAEALWAAKSGFYYKFKDEPVGLEMLASSMTLALPKFIGDRVLLRKIREFIPQVIDVQSGRVRYDFGERLEKSMLDFKREMLRKIDATVEGISVAIKRGMEKRSRSEEEVERRTEAIQDSSKQLDGIRDSLMRVTQEVR